MAVLDTSFLVDITRNSPAAIEILDQLGRTEANIFVAAPSVMELWAGVLKSKKSSGKRKELEEFLASMNILPLERESAKRAAEIESALAEKGITIEAEDVMIAGIAAARGETVVTKDAHYTRISGLRVLKY
ncbi:PIN domain-containing protein [Candidatus Woesearchaeota archaeon]|nr:PIN domain-containing protein [Candidatus Woesearchaeota archaeon]